MTRKVALLVLFIVAMAAVVWLYRGRQPQSSLEASKEAAKEAAKPIGAPVPIAAPLGLPPVPIPADNPPTAETIALGRKLYYDSLLSVDDTVACATCHTPEFGFTDGKQFSEGVNGQQGGRNAPTVFNTAYYTTQFWDGRAPSLEAQAEGPVQNPIEMAHTLEGVEQKLMADSGSDSNFNYRSEFERAFGPGRITYAMVGKAIASFERTVVSGDSPFDRYLFGGESDALSDSAKRGLEVFRDPEKGNCTACHTIDETYALFTDNEFHNLGVDLDSEGGLKDMGRYEVTQNEGDQGAFKTPSLRNVSQTAPYMHDGSLKTLQDVVDFYVGGGSSNPWLDEEMKALDFLTFPERADLLAFLESLTGEMPPDVGPPEGD